MKVKEVAALVGISVRTLHHYDAIGLLKPGHKTETGYRIYTDKELERLQQILFFKELGFSLKKIKEIMDSPSYNQIEALKVQQKMLLAKQKQINTMLETIEKTIKHSKGEITMSNQERFKGFDFRSNPYEQEARERWGNEVEEANKKINNLSSYERKDLENSMIEIYCNLSTIRHQDPASEEAQQWIGMWFDLLNCIGTYSLTAFKGLGKMYVEDERFTKNIDKFGDGLAKFMQEAMAIYAAKHSAGQE
ncbi:MerR family transcriptional regulator [Cerasibacillus sp. JNUCC 74]